MQKFVVGGGGWVCKPILVLSLDLDQAEQLDLDQAEQYYNYNCIFKKLTVE